MLIEIEILAIKSIEMIGISVVLLMLRSRAVSVHMVRRPTLIRPVILSEVRKGVCFSSPRPFYPRLRDIEAWEVQLLLIESVQHQMDHKICVELHHLRIYELRSVQL